MIMTTKDWGYYRDFAKSHNLKPQLSVGHEFCFTDANGKEVRATMLNMKAEAIAYRDALKAAKKREQKYGRKTTEV